jgi:hypothetical protein
MVCGLKFVWLLGLFLGLVVSNLRVVGLGNASAAAAIAAAVAAAFWRSSCI